MSHYHESAIARENWWRGYQKEEREVQDRVAKWPTYIPLSDRRYRIHRNGTLFTLQRKHWLGEWRNAGAQYFAGNPVFEEVMETFEKVLRNPI